MAKTLQWIIYEEMRLAKTEDIYLWEKIYESFSKVTTHPAENFSVYIKEEVVASQEPGTSSGDIIQSL